MPARASQQIRHSNSVWTSVSHVDLSEHHDSSRLHTCVVVDFGLQSRDGLNDSSWPIILSSNMAQSVRHERKQMVLNHRGGVYYEKEVLFESPLPRHSIHLAPIWETSILFWQKALTSCAPYNIGRFLRRFAPILTRERFAVRSVISFPPASLVFGSYPCVPPKLTLFAPLY